MSNHSNVRIDKQVVLRYQNLLHDRDSEYERIEKQIKIHKYRLELWLREDDTNELSDIPCTDQPNIDNQIKRNMDVLIGLYQLLENNAEHTGSEGVSNGS